MKLSVPGKLRSDPWTVIYASAIILILLPVVYPLFNLFVHAFSFILSQKVHVFEGGSVPGFNLTDTLCALKNSILISLAATAIALLAGGALAWLIVRTDIPFKPLIRRLIFLTFCVPSYVLSICCLEIFGTNGFLHNLFMYLGAGKYQISPYSMFFVSLVMGIHLYPLVFFAVSNALSKAGRTLEDAAIQNGASRPMAIITVTMPLILPTILSTALFVFSRTMANYEVPAKLFSPLYRETMTTRIYGAITALDIPYASVLSFILVLISGLALIMQFVLLKNKRQIAVTSSSGSGPRILPLGKRRTLVVVSVMVFIGLTTLVPLGVLFISSILKRWGMEIVLSNFTLDNYRNIIFHNGTAARAFWNSLVYGAVSASIAAFLAISITWMTHYKKISGKRIIEFLASSPMSFPTMVLALGAVLAWSSGWLVLYNTPWIIIITYTALFLPLALKNISGLIRNLDPGLETAARVSGAPPLRAFLNVTLPLIFSGVKSSWMICLLIAFREIPIGLMLHTTGTETVGVLLFNMRSNSGDLESTSAIAVIVILLSVFGSTLAGRWRKKEGISV